jgi:hypothetical protein
MAYLLSLFGNGSLQRRGSMRTHGDSGRTSHMQLQGGKGDPELRMPAETCGATDNFLCSIGETQSPGEIGCPLGPSLSLRRKF